MLASHSPLSQALGAVHTDALPACQCIRNHRESGQSPQLVLTVCVCVCLCVCVCVSVCLPSPCLSLSLSVSQYFVCVGFLCEFCECMSLCTLI